MSSPPTMTAVRAPTRSRSTAGPALPRLLAGIPAHGAMSLEEHISTHGGLPLERPPRGRRGRDTDSPLIDEIERAGLLGHGGAAFPTATKMRAVAASRGRAIVLVNGAEGEPASLKDGTLLEALPHLVLDGAVLAAHALGAEEVLVCVCESATASIESIEQAIEERRLAGDYAAFGRAPGLQLISVPSHYVAGQESALVNFVNGGPAKPTFTPPLPYEQGVRRRPTLVNNAETLAHIALIARHGAAWFRQLGTPTQPGSALVTLSGPVLHPGVYEIEHGASLTSLIEAGGGTTSGLRAVLLGGYAGAWVGAERLQGIALSNEHLAPQGASLGAGVVLLLSEQACPVAETMHLARWLSAQSTRQCGPCVHGLDALAAAVEELAGGRVAPAAGAQRIDRLASLLRRRGACAHPDGAINLILSGLEAFQTEFADHARHGPCDACARPAELPLPLRPVPADAASKPRISA
jgi:NADH:ubiquinone oxidoreductase subunit F (NADH-binding)